jgi:hypothetical protein
MTEEMSTRIVAKDPTVEPPTPKILLLYVPQKPRQKSEHLNDDSEKKISHDRRLVLVCRTSIQLVVVV